MKFLSFIVIGLAAGAVMSSSIILDGMIAVKNSSSNFDMSPLTNLHRMEYAAFPISYFINLPFLENFYENYDLGWPYNSIAPTGVMVFGPSILVLSIIGFFCLKNTILRIIIITMILYWCGPLQILLRF